jgi:hypothetical protein
MRRWGYAYPSHLFSLKLFGHFVRSISADPPRGHPIASIHTRELIPVARSSCPNLYQCLHSIYFSPRTSIQNKNDSLLKAKPFKIASRCAVVTSACGPHAITTVSSADTAT